MEGNTNWNIEKRAFIYTYFIIVGSGMAKLLELEYFFRKKIRIHFLLNLNILQSFSLHQLKRYLSHLFNILNP